jgi:hypothetical protein
MKIYLEEVFPDYVHIIDGGRTITIPIESYMEFDEIMDEIRVKQGKRPLFNVVPGIETDDNGWYEIRLFVDAKTFTPKKLEVWAENTDDRDIYYLDVIDPAQVKRELIKAVEERGMRLEDLVFG